MFDTMTRVWGASAVVFGLAGAAVPERVVDTGGRLLLAGYENPEELEPSAWYVSAVRATFSLTALAGALALALGYAGGGAGSDGDTAAAGGE